MNKLISGFSATLIVGLLVSGAFAQGSFFQPPLEALGAPHTPTPAGGLVGNFDYGLDPINPRNGDINPGATSTLIPDNPVGNTPGVDYIDGPGGAITAYSNSSHASDNFAAVDDMINGTNMNTDYNFGSSRGNGRGEWHTFDPTTPGIGADLVFDRPYQVTDMWIWNGNALNHGGARGVNTMDVLISRDGETLELIADDFVVQRAPDPINQAGIPYGGHDYGGAGTNELSINATIHGVRFTDMTRFADGDTCCFTLNEVRFNIIPEPATFGLLAAGSLLLLKRRRPA